MLNNFDRLRAEHAEILGIIAEIEHLLTPGAVRRKSEIIRELVSLLTRRTLSHLLLEDRCLYQEMMISIHDETRALAQQHVVAMGNMAQTLKDFIQEWGELAHLREAPEEFCDEARHVMGTIAARINREEQVLYPPAEAGW